MQKKIVRQSFNFKAYQNFFPLVICNFRRVQSTSLTFKCKFVRVKVRKQKSRCESFGMGIYLENCKLRNVNFVRDTSNACVSACIPLSRTIGAQITLCTSDHRGYVFIVGEPPMNRHCFLSRFVNWMINRAGEKEVGGEIRSHQVRWASLNSSCAVNVPKALLREWRPKDGRLRAPDIDREVRKAKKTKIKRGKTKSRLSYHPAFDTRDFRSTCLSADDVCTPGAPKLVSGRRFEKLAFLSSAFMNVR